MSVQVDPLDAVLLITLAWLLIGALTVFVFSRTSGARSRRRREERPTGPLLGRLRRRGARNVGPERGAVRSSSIPRPRGPLDPEPAAEPVRDVPAWTRMERARPEGEGEKVRLSRRGYRPRTAGPVDGAEGDPEGEETPGPEA